MILLSNVWCLDQSSGFLCQDSGCDVTNEVCVESCLNRPVASRKVTEEIFEEMWQWHVDYEGQLKEIFRDQRFVVARREFIRLILTIQKKKGPDNPTCELLCLSAWCEWCEMSGVAWVVWDEWCEMSCVRWVACEMSCVCVTGRVGEAQDPRRDLAVGSQNNKKNRTLHSDVGKKGYGSWFGFRGFIKTVPP